MTADTDAVPAESDILAVEQRLAALWSELPPAQQAVLDSVIASGLCAISMAADTSGFVSQLTNPMAVEEYIRSRTAELREDARRAHMARDAEPGPRRRWNLSPLLDWLRRAAPTDQRLRPQGGSPA